MYTQCPDCDTAFRVTAPLLQQAAGRVVCGGCGHAFNALERLTEDPPAAMEIPDDAKSILETLNELTGPHEIRIEDTGVEWRVYDEEDLDEEVAVQQAEVSEPDSGDTGSLRWYIDDNEGEAQEDVASAEIDDPLRRSGAEASADHSLELAPEDPGRRGLQVRLRLPPSGNAGDVQRYDDNTPLPEDFVDESDPAVPQRRAEDRIELRSSEADEAQVNLALGEPDEWMDLLDEVGNARSESEVPARAGNVESPGLDASGAFAVAGAAYADGLPAPSTAEMRAEMAALADTGIRMLTDDEPALDDSFPSDIDTQFDLQAIEMGIDLTGNREALTELSGKASGTDHAGGLAALPGPGEPAEADIELSLIDDEDEQRHRLIAHETEGGDEDEDERRRERAFEEELATAYAITLDDEPAKSPDELARPEHFVPPPTEEEMTVNMLIDQDLIRLAEQQDVFRSAAANRKLEDLPHVETIIMEGEFVRTALEAELLAEKKAEAGTVNRDVHRPPAAASGRAAAASSDDAAFLLDTYIKTKDRVRGGRRRTDPASYKVIGGVVVLALILGAQVVHAYRDSLATYGAFDKTLGSVYRMLGDPLTPDWNVKGWQFETTSGSTDATDEVLTISSRVLNSSAKSLPYPLLHVSLTDRWEEIIGSKVLEPDEYLAGAADPGSRVPAGERFTAVVRVDAPSPEATGFKLNVCYREADKRVRCATEDFKD
ncbi:MAG: zinc-ribbon and DUF3426 domain-containing protein [Woeseia sp.]